MNINPKKLEKTRDVSKGYSSKKEQFKDLFIQIFFLFVGLLALVYIASLFGSHVPDSLEKALRYKSLISDQKLQKKYSSEVSKSEKIFEKLANLGIERSLEYEIVVIESSAPNAFAFPGGLVGVTTGLLKSVKTEAALAFVLAHELGHHELRHVTKRLSFSVFLQAISAFFTGGSGMGELTKLGANGLLLSYGREEELEADQYAAGRIYALYGNLKGAEEFFEQIISYEKEHNLTPKYGSFFSTHPLTTGRLDSIKKNLSK
jgi:Zn-dependent protease with chaperone function